MAVQAGRFGRSGLRSAASTIALPRSGPAVQPRPRVEPRNQHEIAIDATGHDDRDPAAGRYELEQASQPLSFSVGD